MKKILSLRALVILGVISLTAILSGAIFYLTAFRFERISEGVMAQLMSRRCETAARLWGSGISAQDLAQIALDDSSIILMVFTARNQEKQVFSRQAKSTSQAAAKPSESLPGGMGDMGAPSRLPRQRGHVMEVVAISDSGRVECIFSTAMADAEVARLLTWGLEVIGIVVVVAGAGVYFVDRRLGRVVKRMIETAGKIGSGDLDRPLIIRTGDSLEELGAAFNRLAAELSSRQAEIDRATAELAATVATQTAELRQERDRMSMILENLPSAFILFDQDLTVLAATSAVERLPGVTLGADHRQACSCHLKVSGDSGCIIRSAQSRGEAVTGRRSAVTVNGLERSYEYCAYPVREDGKIVGWLETITDISEQVRQQARVIKAERLSIAGELAATLAHEMRNRLTSVKMLLQLEIEASNLTAAQREHQGRIADSVQDMERMIEELLAFARPAPLSSSLVNLTELVDEGIRAVEPMAKASGVSVECVNRTDRDTAKLDLNKMRQTLSNLLLNAIQHAGSSGKVTLSVDRVEDPGWAKRLRIRSEVAFDEADARASVSGDLLCFDIEDTGPGVPVNLRTKIFEPFFSTRSSGTGLGLAMVRRSVRDQGGTVLVEDSPLGGARFRVILPVKEL